MWEEVGAETYNRYNREKAWSSINHSILSIPHFHSKENTFLQDQKNAQKASGQDWVPALLS